MDINLENVWKTYSLRKGIDVNAIRGISINFRSGSFVSIMGPSGCGKTTLLNLIGCADIPTKGAIFFGDEEVSACSDQKRSSVRNANVGYVLQDFGLIESLTVQENVRLPLLFSDTDYKQHRNRILASLDQVGLVEYSSRLVSRLSGGQRQRIAIARALVMDPEIILADEPTGALDSLTAQNIVNLLAELNERGKTIIVATHDSRIAEKSLLHYKMLDGAILENK